MASSPEEQPGAVAWSKLAKTASLVLLGILLGFLGVTRGCASAAKAGSINQERYAVVVANLFAEGESLHVIADYIPALNSSDPSGVFLRLADRYAQSSDRQRQRWSEDLRQLGQALAKGIPEEEKSLPASPSPSPTRPGQPAVATAQSTPTVPPATGVVRTHGEGGLRLRAEPTTNAPALALLANGARVEILNVVDGQTVLGTEKRWYKVRSGQQTGYVYFQFLTPAD